MNFNDLEIYLLKGKLLVCENNLLAAQKILEEGIDKFPRNVQLQIMLGEVLEKQNDLTNAYERYTEVEKLASDNEKELICNLKKNVQMKMDKMKLKPLITFFVKKGMNSFLDNIVRGLRKEYRTKCVVVSELSQIEFEMMEADICWFEWCDELIIHASNLPIAKEKRIICRLHSYEAFTNYIYQVSWEMVDKVIFVAEHIKEHVLNIVKSLTEKQTVVIPNGIDLNQYTFRDRNKGFNIAYVGYINYKKGPMLLLHSFKDIYDYDNRYKLFIAGEFQDARYILYFQQMIREFGLKNNVVFNGWIDDINQWLENKDYIISTSVLESQHLSIMEAMAKGIKPLIHNLVGAKSIYPEHLIWNQSKDLITLIDSSYDSEEYRKFVQKEYSIEQELGRIRNLLEQLLESTSIDNKKTININVFSFRYKEKKVKFYLPNLNDHIQKIVRYTNSFYEIEMLQDIEQRITENSIVIDVGANIGNHTIFFGGICNSTVHAIEPQKDVFEILRKNVELNQLNNNVSLYNFAMGSSKTKAQISLFDPNNLGATEFKINDSGEVDVRTLDHLFLELKKVDLIKIDVEGMEMDVLQGGKPD